jgi:DNA polymerase
MAKFVPGMGPFSSRLMIVGEAPGKNEDEQGRPFVGPSGELLDKFLEEAGSSRNQVYVTNVRKYRPPNNDFTIWNPGEPDLDTQVKLLWDEIESVKPNCILALGERALTALTGKKGIGNWRGSILPSIQGIPKVVATWHPANLLYQNDDIESGRGVFKFLYKQVIRHDIARALEESLTETLDLPERTLEICHGSLHFYRFVEEIYKNGKTAVDIEALKCVPDCMSFSAGRAQGMSIPLFDAMSCVNVRGIPATELAHIWKAAAEVLNDPKIKKIGQNFKYDEDKILRLGFVLDMLWGDTSIASHVLNPEMPKFLGFLSSIYTREPYYKDERKEFDIKKDSYERRLLYNAKDAPVTEEVHDCQYEEMTELGLIELYHTCYMPRHRFYLDMERVGFRVDEVKRQQLLDKYLLLYETVHARTTGNLGYDLNVGSTPQVIRCVYTDLKLPMRFKVRKKKDGSKIKTPSADEETLTALMANNAKSERTKNILSDILEERKIRKTVSTYILAKPDYDGRMRTCYNICGTETDRTSTSNIAAPIRPEKSMGVAFQTLTKHGDVGADICEMYIPDEGYVFINADLSQAEARVVFVLAEDWESLALLDDPRFDLHWQVATWVFKELPNVFECKAKLDKEDMRRFIGKTGRHAGNLGIQKHTFMMNVNTDAKKYGFDLKISEWRAGKILEEFHKNCPKVRGVFHATIEEKLNKDRILDGPLLYDPYGNVMSRGTRRMFFDRWSNDLLKEAYSYLPQSVVSNQTKHAGMRVQRRLKWVKYVLEGHDALLALIPNNENQIAEYIGTAREELERPIDFSFGTFQRDYKLIIPADFTIGRENYKDLEKFKKVA